MPPLISTHIAITIHLNLDQDWQRRFLYNLKAIISVKALNPGVRCAFGNAYYDDIIAITTGIELVRSHSVLNGHKVLANI